MKTDCERDPNELSVVGHEMDDDDDERNAAEDPFAELEGDHQDEDSNEEPFEIPAPNVILSD